MAFPAVSRHLPRLGKRLATSLSALLGIFLTLPALTFTTQILLPGSPLGPSAPSPLDHEQLGLLVPLP